jgi:3-phenylpropionate/trans-cinnamate dioxygenase ferredoxin subunit
MAVEAQLLAPSPSAGPGQNPPPAAQAAAPAGKQRVVVAKEIELPAGTRKIVRVGGREIGVFHTQAGWFALRNTCPHQGAPLCLGTVTGTTLPSKPGEYTWGMDGQVLRCPWHGWEFDLNTGVGLYDPYRHERVATYRVQVEDGEVILYA